MTMKKRLRYLSVCSGIEAATVAWHPLGWEPVAFSEIEKFPSAVLQHHYPDVPNHGDMTKHKEWPHADVDVLVGGTPCQSFSVAGLRKGLSDPRGNLMLTFGSIAQKYKPRWIVWENVPGVLSSDGGRDFGTFLGMLGELGYGAAYRVLDAQYFGVAQRRRRVFAVGYLGDWRRAAAVLFERESLRGDPPPSREARKDVADYAERRIGSGSQTIGTLLASAGKYQFQNNQEAFTGDYHVVCPPISPCLETQHGGLRHPDTQAYAVCPALTASMSKPLGYGGKDEFICFGGDVARTLSARHDSSPCADRGMDVVADQWAVRRLTPVECERLQGFSDGYTAIPWRGKPADQCPDGPRYKALGNSMAVPVMNWIGRRINMIEEIAS